MSEHVYDPAVVEKKWQQRWDSEGTNRVDLQAAANPLYVLMMFPYPSAEGLHVGNVYAFTGADVYGRHMRTRGFDVFEPIGFDAFGIHSENFAMKVNRHPAELIPANVANFTRQLKMMGLMYDWNRTVDTTSPEYYKWTQWVFLKLYKAGFVYRDIKEVNYCPDCGTVISDEQVMPDGTCERHSATQVQRRKMPCWFFRITAFAERLAKNHDWLDWSEKTKLTQLDWIRMSEGAEVDFRVDGRDEKIRIFTTRPDTLFGATFMVLAPEHPLVDAIADPSLAAKIAEYRRDAAARTEADRTDDARRKTGLFIGAHGINPVNQARVPIYIADYVLMGYGTGAIMAVPAHDERDFEFARMFNIPVRCVIDPGKDAAFRASVQRTHAAAKDSPLTLDETMRVAHNAVLDGAACWTGDGELVNSANAEVSINALPVDEAKARITAWLAGKGLGERKVTFRLRDWGISRQRYWGPPIPIVYDEQNNPHPVPEEQLPVRLPELRDFRPKGDGRGPLANVPEWYNTTLPDGRPARRETDVMDNFLDSAWYFLRYVSSNDPERPWDPALIRKWLPVDMYIGGNEHAVLHLLYTRFLCMALSEAGVLEMGERAGMRDRAEPFRKFRAHGLLIKDGHKMSKVRGNIVIPDNYVATHGADTLRAYLMFLGPYQQGGDFSDSAIEGIRRFLNRVYYWYAEAAQPIVPDAELPRTVAVKLHQTIKKVAADIEALSYNTAIAALMELYNEAKAAPATSAFLRESFIAMLAPFCPHIAEEIWRTFLHKQTTVFAGTYPKYDPALTVLDQVEIVLQHNGKIRDRAVVSRTASKEELEALARNNPHIAASLKGESIVRIVVVPGRLANVISSPAST